MNDLLRKIKRKGVKGISDDTRYLTDGELFVCLKGNNYNGENFIIEACNKGAKAILSNHELKTAVVPVIKTNINLNKNFPELISKYYDYPQRELRLVGVTGTDGKTTTSTFVEFFLNLQYKACYIGTNGIRFLDHNEKTTYTTLPLCLLIKNLRRIADQNVRYVSMEVSSQGLIDNRLEGVEFDCAVFTNLSHEHLDTHKTMNNYFKAKSKLFEKVDNDGVVITNIDDKWGKKIKHCNLITYSLYDNNSDYQIKNIRKNKKYIIFDLRIYEHIYNDLKVFFNEEYNLYNLLASIACATYYKISIDLIIKNLCNLPKVEGRMELLTTNENFRVYVDFAHTPNALKLVLENLKETTSGNLISVLGCAGKKDKTKRCIMGEIALKLSDYVIFTSEDPRDENPEDIIKEMIGNYQNKKTYEVIIDRKKAISKAIELAHNKDTIIITGKGNDTYFEEKNHFYEYSDIQEVVNELNRRKNLIEI